MKNKYIKHKHFSECKFREILRLFSEDLTAVQISNFTGVNRNSVNRILKLIRQRILELTTLQDILGGLRSTCTYVEAQPIIIGTAQVSEGSFLKLNSQ